MAKAKQPTRTPARTPARPQDTAQIEAFDHLLKQAGGDPDTLNGKLIREMMHTAVKLIRDEADTGELKLISRSLKELRYALKVFRDYRDTRKISVFGSARTPIDHPDYKAAEDFSRLLAEAGWMVITGAGPGIMQAGHGGAGAAASFGVSIRLPFEASANEIIAGDPKLITFRYFFTRKLMFMSQSAAVALFPGGYGTQDEGFEALTLIQTGKAPIVPIVMVDPPGGTYWKKWDEYVRDELLAANLISPEDLNLYLVTDDVQVAVDEVLNFYSNFHSQRFVRDTLVLRVHTTLSDDDMAALNDEFNDLVTRGRITQGQPFDVEKDHRELPRIKFAYNANKYGRLRLMIDRINQFARRNAATQGEG